MGSEETRKGELFCRFGDRKEGAEGQAQAAACSSVGEPSRHRHLLDGVVLECLVNKGVICRKVTAY